MGHLPSSSFYSRLQKKCCQRKLIYRNLLADSMFGARLHPNHFLLFKSSLGLSLPEILSHILRPVFLVLFIVARKHKEIKKMAPYQWHLDSGGNEIMCSIIYCSPIACVKQGTGKQSTFLWERNVWVSMCVKVTTWRVDVSLWHKLLLYQPNKWNQRSDSTK